MWLHSQLCCSFTFAISRYGYWNAISITLIEKQLDSLSRAAQVVFRPCINACARACAYKIRREGYTGYTGLGNTLERMQHATRLNLRLRDIARCVPSGIQVWETRAHPACACREATPSGALYMTSAHAHLLLAVPLLETFLRRCTESVDVFPADVAMYTIQCAHVQTMYIIIYNDPHHKHNCTLLVHVTPNIHNKPSNKTKQ